MATKRISALTAASAAALTDQIPIEDASNATKKLTAAQLAALLVTGSTINAALGYTAANAAALNASALTSGTVPLARLSGITNAEIAAGAAIADTKLATISTSGKVANAATTATAANTADAIVARDGDGDIAIRDLAARDIAATTLAGDGSAVTDLDADELTAGTVATARLGEGNAHEYGGLAALGSMWLGAPPVSLAIARGGTGLATSITVNGIALTVTRPSAVITRLGGLVTAPTFARSSVANNPQSGAQVGVAVPRYCLGRNLLSKNQSDVETNTTGFTDLGAGVTTLTRDTSEFWRGTASLKAVTSGTHASQGMQATTAYLPGVLPAGASVTVSAYVKGSAVPLLIRGTVYYTDGTDTPVTVSFTGAATFTRQSATVTATAGKTISRVAIWVYIDGTGAHTYYVDGLQVELGATATPWVVGGDHAILVERGTQNLLTITAEVFVGWTALDSSTPTITPGQADPFGGTAAHRVQCTAGAGTTTLKYYLSPVVPAPGVRHSTSIWIKAVADVTIGTNLGGSVSVTAADGWKLVKIEGMTGDGVTSSQLRFEAATAGSAVDCYAMWPQIEEGVISTSFILPGASRSAEVETLPAVCNPAEGTVIVRADVSGDLALATANDIYLLFDAWQLPTQNRLILGRNAAGWFAGGYGSDGIVLDFAIWTSALAERGHTFAMTYGDGVIELWVDGVLRDSGVWNAAMPTILPNTAVGCSGSDGAGQYGRAIEAVHIYDRKLPAVEMAVLTAADAAELPAHPAETFRQTYAGSLDYTARVVDVTSSGGLVTAAARSTATIAA